MAGCLWWWWWWFHLLFHFSHPALKSSPSKKGRSALLAVKMPGPTAAFSASQLPSEKDETQYDLRAARSYPTLDDEGSSLVRG